MLKEFKEFAIKGNMIDMAIGIVIGAAFGTIIASLVADILMPVLGLLTGGVDFSSQFVVLKAGATPGPYLTPATAAAAGAVTLNYGKFLNNIVSFLIVALAMFMVVKAMNKMKKQEAAAPVAPPEPPKSELLLQEIRDALVQGKD